MNGYREKNLPPVNVVAPYINALSVKLEKYGGNITSAHDVIASITQAVCICRNTKATIDKISAITTTLVGIAERFIKLKQAGQLKKEFVMDCVLLLFDEYMIDQIPWVWRKPFRFGLKWFISREIDQCVEYLYGGFQ